MMQSQGSNAYARRVPVVRLVDCVDRVTDPHSLFDASEQAMDNFKNNVLALIGAEPVQKQQPASADSAKQPPAAEEEESGKKKKRKTPSKAPASTAPSSKKRIGGGTFSQVYGIVALPKAAFDKILRIARGDFTKPTKGGLVSNLEILVFSS